MISYSALNVMVATSLHTSPLTFHYSSDSEYSGDQHISEYSLVYPLIYSSGHSSSGYPLSTQ